jgi:hypothetical protein
MSLNGRISSCIAQHTNPLLYAHTYHFQQHFGECKPIHGADLV